MLYIFQTFNDDDFFAEMTFTIHHRNLKMFNIFFHTLYSKEIIYNVMNYNISLMLINSDKKCDS